MPASPNRESAADSAVPEREAMTSVIVQPCGPGEPADRYNDTIAKPVVFSDHATVISAADLARLNELFPEGRAPILSGSITRSG
jgi:hypothetical protein